MINLFQKLTKTIYKNYCGVGKKKSSFLNKFMTVDDFRQIINDCGLINEDYPEAECNSAFGLSTMTQVDEINYDRYSVISYVEFLEALARVAERTITYR